MSLKTDYHYNEDDYVERSGQLDELTVTITLCEYRNLITEQTRLDMTVDRLQEEKVELEKKLQAASEITRFLREQKAELIDSLVNAQEGFRLCNTPEWVQAIAEKLDHVRRLEQQGGATQDERPS